MKLAKMLYLADLRAVQAGEVPVSGVEWKWLHHGPFSNALLDLEDQLVADGVVSSEPRSYAFGREVRLRLVNDTGLHLPEDEERYLIDIVAEMGNLAASSLKQLSYQTPPMVEALKGGHRGVVLDLDIVRPVPRVRRTLARLREVLREQPEEFDDDDVEEEMARELEELAPLRGAANRLMIGDP
ncbi:type II toxin-antitoxin system antitoxin SocA domain-containing protein [Frankia sp. CcI49]|uniref:type II toxin-antitoxin system antitoxin SocA domain-containing protein n=1 Tax=Frankia sp. CcI49 TaxID=1745382 RepID=UPI001054D81B|nr:type II toxin-antitoxin system antitoxin SocA domain-containing protein [Frankia sp. CcI49]